MPQPSSKPNRQWEDLAETYLFPPARAARVAQTEFERRQNAPFRIDWGTPELNEVLTPLMGGDMVSIIGRPGHAKTSLLIAFSKYANKIVKGQLAPGSKPPVTVFATWETMVEEFVALSTASQSGQTMEDLARGTADLAKIGDAVARYIGSGMIVIGRSITEAMKPQAGNSRMSRFLTAERVALLLEHIAKEYTICLVAWDFLQRMPGANPEMNRSMIDKVIWNTFIIKEIGMAFGCPNLVAVQSKRDVDKYDNIRFPTMGDGQWSSTIEQDSDKILTITKPCLYLPAGSTVKDSARNRVYNVNDSLVAVRVAKQRWTQAGGVRFIDLNPSLLTYKDPDWNEGVVDEDTPDDKIPF